MLKKQKLILGFFVISIIISSLLLGDYFNMLYSYDFNFLLNVLLNAIYLTLTITFISFIYGIIKIKKFNSELLKEIKKVSCVFAFSLITTLVVATILPYILFYNSFLNTFVVQYIYLLPVLFILFFSLHFYHDSIYETKSKYKKIIKGALITSLGVSLIISIIIFSAGNFIYNNKYIDSEHNSDKMLELLDYNLNQTYPDLIVFEEIKEYGFEIKNNLENYKQTKNNLCFPDQCIKESSRYAYDILYFTISTVMVENNFEVGMKYFNYTQSDEFKQNFNSLEEYKIHLEEKVNNSVVSEYYQLKKNEKMEKLLQSDFNYNEFLYMVDYYGGKFEETPYVFSLLIRPKVYDPYGSIFKHAQEFTVTHTKSFQEIARLIVKIMYFLDKPTKLEIYQNKNINESVESKIVRYGIIIEGSKI